MFIYQYISNNICWFLPEGNMRHYVITLIENKILTNYKIIENGIMCGFYNTNRFKFIVGEFYHLIIEKNNIEVIYSKHNYVPFYLRPSIESLKLINDDTIKKYFKSPMYLIDEYSDENRKEEYKINLSDLVGDNHDFNQCNLYNSIDDEVYDEVYENDIITCDDCGYDYKECKTCYDCMNCERCDKICFDNISICYLCELHKNNCICEQL